MAILTEVESGTRQWDDSISRLEQQILMPYPLKRSFQFDNVQKKTKPNVMNVSNVEKKVEKLWYCSKFQKNECEHTDTHVSEVNNRTTVSHHVCANCWLKDRVKSKHPSSSTSCPHYEH